MKNEKIESENITNETQEKIDDFLKRAKKKISEGKLDFTPLGDGSGYSGTQHISFSSYKDDPTHHVFYFSIIDSNYKKLASSISFSGTKEQAKNAKTALSNLLGKEYKLFDYKHDDNLENLDDDKLKFIIRRKLKTLENEFPKEFSFKNSEKSKKYFFSSVRYLPIPRLRRDGYTKSENIQLIIKIRDATCIERAKTEYIELPAHFNLSIGTKEIDKIGEIETKIHKILNSYSAFEYTIKNNGLQNTDKIIPKDWVDPSKIRVKTRKLRNGRNHYDIDIIPESIKNRIPPISTSLTNASRDEAEEIKNYLQNENSIIYSYLNGEHKDKPLTLKTIRNDLESKFPEIINKTSERSPARSDIRNVAHNNDIKMTLLTPSFNQKGQFCIIHIVPPKEGKERAIDKNINIPLNTADTDLAIGRINALQSLTKIAIEEYFDKNPNIQILTETKVTLQNGKPSNGVTFKDPQPGKITPEGKILFETLRKDILKPAYEQFNRYIYWETKIEEDKESGKYKITAQIKRNKDSEEFPENDEIMGKLWKFQANDKETATKFVHTLEENILRKEHSFSRDRPVEQFGVESMRLVTKKSLLETLKTTPEIEDLQEHLTKLLNAGRKIT